MGKDGGKENCWEIEEVQTVSGPNKMKGKGAREMSVKRPTEFADLNHSVHVFDADGNRLADIDENGVKMYSSAVMISVCKKTGEDDGWPKYETIYLPERLVELAKSKIEPCGPIPYNNTDTE